jgi:hypothetical protein
MSTENLVLAILKNKAADSKKLFEEVIVEKVQNLVEAKTAETANLMLDEETKNSIEYFNDVHNYFNHLLEGGIEIEKAINMLREDENIGDELAETYLTLLDKYLEENGPEDPEDEDCEEEDEEEEETDESGDVHKDATP